ncbi:alpha-tocopherol transfer protein-like [Pomacea canaliculata]|uniref:alpha-tocopherol transfer protein-like n=1 Tax=Pomacea canaliculata TaxID=400727 RepID=UPI000D73A9D4|nr:alpha-tocopherol transfer protein-like [Pomacea canaliculata]
MAKPAQGTYTCTLREEMLEKAKKELNEDPKTRLLEIKALRERVEKVPGLRSRTEDTFLLRFLRARKFDQENAYKQLIQYYQTRKENPDVFENLTPKRVQFLLEAGVDTVLQNRAPDGSRVIVFRPGKWDPDKCDMATVIGSNHLTLSKLIEEEETQVCGVTMLIDLKEVGWHQAKHISPFTAKKFTTIIQEAFPVRFKGLHYLNEPTFFDVVFAIVKQFMKEKILRRIHIHGDKMESLHQFLPADILPVDYGGKLPPLSSKQWMEKLVSCEAHFADENKFGFLDMTIPANPKTGQDATESLGGTFRRLNVD